MSNLTDLISAGGGSASYPTIFLSKSQTWVPPQDGNIMIHVIGAGGSGSAHIYAFVTGGGAGGYCKKNSLAVTTSGSFTVVVGAGGASVFNGGNGATTGNAGGNTTVAGTGLSSTLTANGGAAGVTSGSNPTGGTASNGDVNTTGGGSAYAMGGGAVGLTGTGNSGYQLGNLWMGGDCDVIGNLWSSSLGQIAGGKGGNGFNVENRTVYANNSSSVDAEPLAGGGTSWNVAADADYYSVAGHASIGGGGGGNRYNNQVNRAISGRGGEGIVVIQYIP